MTHALAFAYPYFFEGDLGVSCEETIRRISKGNCVKGITTIIRNLEDEKRNIRKEKRLERLRTATRAHV